MFFRKRKNKIVHIMEWERELLKTISEKIPKQYSFLENQLKLEIILDSVPNEILKDGWKRVICDQNVYNKLRTKGINYQLKGIRVHDLIKGDYTSVTLDFYEGILIGYKIDGWSGSYDLSKIDLTDLEELPYETSAEDAAYERLLKNKKSSLLDLENGFEIEIEGRQFYVIKDFESGDYISIDRDGKVYGMFHDPLIIELLDDSVTHFIDQVNNGYFSLSDYYNTKYR